LSSAVPETTAAAGAAAPKRLRTVYCTRGGLFGASVLARLRASDRIEICAIVRSSRTFHPEFGFLRGALALIRRSGIPYALYLFLVTTIADALCGLSKLGRVPLRTRVSGMPVFTTRDINRPDGLRFLEAQSPDLLVSAFFDQRLHEKALGVPAYGCLNIHPSVLPSFRGVDPVLQARLHGAGALGVTVHWMTPVLDAGRVLAQRAIALPVGSSIFEATALLYRAGADLLVGTIDRIEARFGSEPRGAPGSYQSWPTRLEVHALHRLGSVLIRLADFRRLLSLR
jgi:methionyl-tRNA formyltransferase